MKASRITAGAAPFHAARRLVLPAHGTRTGLSLRVNFAWTFFGNAWYNACQWGMLVVLAKLGTPVEVGHFALALAITAPVFMFTNLQLRGAQATDARGEYAFGHYLALRLVMSAVALLAIGGIVLVAGYRGEAGGLVLVIGLAKAMESISDVFWGLYQQHERMDRIAISSMIKGTLALIALAGGVLLTRNLVVGAAGLAAAYVITLVAYDIRTGVRTLISSSGDMPGTTVRAGVRKLRPRWTPRVLVRLAWLTLPLGIVLSLLSLNYGIPRYFIQHDLGDRSLGFYAATSYLMVAGGMIMGALGQSASPRLAQFYAAGRRSDFLSLLFKLVVLGVGIGVIGIAISVVAGHWILTLVYRPAYAAHANVLTWLMVAALVSYVAEFLGYGLTAARQFRVQIPVALTLVTTTAVGTALFLPHFNLVGAAYAVLTANIAWALVSAAVVLYALTNTRSLRTR